jgi:cell wall-associated NlpC family hydrolase
MKRLLRLFLVLAAGLATLLVAGCAGLGGSGLSGKRAQVVSAALSQVGTPYRYGGNEPGRGLDCSGLTHYAYQTAGVNIPRMSVAQRLSARPVDPNAPTPGDLVFFRTGPGVHHVGLVVEGDRFVHASTSLHKVAFARLHTPYWAARYLGAGTYLE